MDQEKIKNKLFEVVAKFLGKESSEIKGSDKLFQKDSLTSVEMLIALEENFAVVIHDQEVSRLSTIEDALNLIAKKRLGE